MPLQATSGAASYDAFGGGAPAIPQYIEEVFSTDVYTGNGAARSITNGIDLAGKGGLVWLKNRSNTSQHYLFDTNRGALNEISSSDSSVQVSLPQSLTAFNSDGFSLGTDNAVDAASPFVTWTFRKQPKFFDVVTYTGTGANRTIAHNLGSVPGCIIVKRTNTTSSNWQVYHRSLANTEYMELNITGAVLTGATRWNSTTPTSTEFSLGTDATVNASGGTYVAYLFAHNAGGFGLTGSSNVISCGIYTGNGSATGPVINLGYEPQWLMIKPTASGPGWTVLDSMRGMPVKAFARQLEANSTSPEFSGTAVSPTAIGFQPSSAVLNESGDTYLYIAIRRGPMQVPTTGTSVFGLNARTGTGVNATVTGGAGVTDLAIIKNRGVSTNWVWTQRLLDVRYLSSNSFVIQQNAGTTILQANPWDVMDGVKVGTTSDLTNASGNTFINYLLDRAPSFMDVVCYTGTGAGFMNVAHNLAAVPELMLVKGRNNITSTAWQVYSGALANTEYLVLNTTAAKATGTTRWNSTTPTATVFTLGNATEVNTSAADYVAYLFATCPDVSKVGSYTGTGTTLQIDCGFTGGARFVMIKRTDSTGDWYVWDTDRGIVSGNDPYLRFNTTGAEQALTDYIDPYSAGFEISSTAPAAINASGGSFIFLAIA